MERNSGYGHSRSAEKVVLITVVDSRGMDVVKDRLGEDFNSPVIVDGWKAYSCLKTIQRCWAHLILEVDTFMNTDHGKELSDKILSMFREPKESLKSENMGEHKSMKDFLERRMEDLIKCYDPHRELHKPVEYIRNGLGSPVSYIWE